MTSISGVRSAAAARHMRIAKAGAIAAGSVVMLAACSSNGAEDGYVDAYFDNGDPIYAPYKADLWNEDGTPTCEYPVYLNRVETRARNFTTNGGVINGFLFEVQNPELSPEGELLDAQGNPVEFADEAAEEAERERREQRLGSLDRLYQMTSPEFDAAFGIDGPEDLADVKTDIASRVPELGGPNNPVAQSIAVGDQWIETDQGRYEVDPISDVELFIDVQGINHNYDGFTYFYNSARIGTDLYLFITDKETGEKKLLNADGETTLAEAQLYQQYDVLLDPGNPQSGAVRLTVENDGCPVQDDQIYARYWVVNWEPIEPVVEDEE